MNLKALRKAKGLTLAELAKKVGVSAGTISRWESGEIANMRRDRIALLSKALGITPVELLGLPTNSNTAANSKEMMANYFGVSKADLVEDSPLSHGYYTDPETAELAEKFRNNSDLRVLFQASADLSPEKMKEAYNYIKFLRDQEKGESD
ncbi:helix-turn-helix domain-containing protein [uncultured Veillonella sp.]|jgi:transcriptional regulator with XRE-family HTH domain|uniref:helix-turn-helix domain-containing protein n=1 Tax=uncultured Veillonella sp. TaxID=159268 RepID=UPI00258F84FC|nr:helix-turn-helix transcriptional regulator [uncultured Veillonella sp.]